MVPLGFYHATHTQGLTSALPPLTKGTQTRQLPLPYCEL